MIPKRIITTWICDPARDRYTDRSREMFSVCMDSWLRLMPDYEIWVITLGSLEPMQDDWLKARVDEGNFIACSQWARLYYLHTFGGIFFDADVQAVRRFDPLLGTDAFTLGHLGNGQQFANNAIMVAPQRHQFTHEMFRRLRQIGDTKHPDFGNLSGPFMVTTMLNQYGWDGRDVDAIVPTAGGPVTVRRSKAFHPYSFNENYSPSCVEPDTFAIHHWASSWKKVEEQSTQSWR